MKRLLPVLMGFVVLLGMQQAQAFDPEHLKRLKETNKCPRCDLQGTDLQGADLRNAKLQGADLSMARPAMVASSGEARLTGAFETNRD